MYLQRATHPLVLCQLTILLPVSTLHPSMGLTWLNGLTWNLSLPFGLWALFKPLLSYAASRFLPTEPGLLMVLADLILALSCHCTVLDCLLIVVATNRAALLALLRCHGTAPIQVKNSTLLLTLGLSFPILTALGHYISSVFISWWFSYIVKFFKVFIEHYLFFFFSNHPSFLLP